MTQIDPNPSNENNNYWLLPNFLQKHATQALFLVLVAFFCYANSIPAEYAVDDSMVILDNAYTQAGFKGLGKILTEDSFAGSQGGLRILAGGRYRPLSLVTFAIEYQFFKKSPHLSHFVNVALFTLSVVLLFNFLKRFIFPKIPEAAFLATLIFALHPIHTEAVANIKGRDEILSFLFVILTLDYGLRYYFSPILKHLMGLAGFYFLALLSKENGLTLVGLLPVTLWVFTPVGLKDIKSILRAMYPVLGVLLFYFIIRFKFTGLPTEGVSDVLNNTFALATFEQKYATIAIVFSMYLKIMFFPHPLSWDYAYQQVPYHDFSDPLVWASLLLNLALLAFGFWGTWKKNIFGYAILFYFASLFLVSNIIINIGGVLGERFLYQASFSLALVVGYAAALALQNKALKIAVVGVLTFVCIAGTMKTIARNADWEDNFTLFRKDVDACPNSAVTNRACGSAYLSKAAEQTTDGPEKQVLVRDGIPYLYKAIRIYPKFFEAYLDLGSGYFMAHQIDSAEKYWNVARSINARHPLLVENDKLLGNSYGLQGYNLGRSGKLDSAIVFLQKAVAYDSTNAATWNTLGIVRSLQKNGSEAIRCLKKATALQPATPGYWSDLGLTYTQAGDFANALNAYQTVLKLDPNNAVAKGQIQALSAKK